MRVCLGILIVLFALSCSRPVFKSSWTNEKAPDSFTTRFETSKGSFDVQLNRAWSPLGVDRVYQLVKHHYYDNSVFYRVIPGFVAQFGGADTAINRQWRAVKLIDENVIGSNKRGIMSFARGGKDNRNVTLFINLQDNQRLDTGNANGVIGYPPVGWVTRGMDLVDSVYSGYGQIPSQPLRDLYNNRPNFVKAYPKLDIITKAYIIKTRN